jgi:hypothetical protein
MLKARLAADGLSRRRFHTPPSSHCVLLVTHRLIRWADFCIIFLGDKLDLTVPKLASKTNGGAIPDINLVLAVVLCCDLSKGVLNGTQGLLRNMRALDKADQLIKLVHAMLSWVANSEAGYRTGLLRELGYSITDSSEPHMKYDRWLLKVSRRPKSGAMGSCASLVSGSNGDCFSPRTNGDASLSPRFPARSMAASVVSQYDDEGVPQGRGRCRRLELVLGLWSCVRSQRTRASAQR